MPAPHTHGRVMTEETTFAARTCRSSWERKRSFRRQRAASSIPFIICLASKYEEGQIFGTMPSPTQSSLATEPKGGGNHDPRKTHKLFPERHSVLHDALQGPFARFENA
jgi:hypothetical protein